MNVVKFMLLLLSAIELPEWAIISNIGPNCLWACLTVQGKLHDVDETDNAILDKYVMDKMSNRSIPWTEIELQEYLKKMGADFKMTRWPNKKDFSILKEYGSSYGVVVSMHQGFRPGWVCHAILITHFTDTEVHYWDPNFPKMKFKTNRQWFDYWWTGTSIVVFKK